MREETADRVRQLYHYRRRRFSARFDDGRTESDGIEARSEDYQRLVREILDAQRATCSASSATRADQRRRHAAIERELDLEDSRLEI